MQPDCAHRQFTLFEIVHRGTRPLFTISEVAGEYIDGQNIDFYPQYTSDALQLEPTFELPAFLRHGLGTD